MHNKRAQHQLAITLIGIAQAIIEGRLLLTEFASVSNIDGGSRVEFDLIDCELPVAQERQTAPSSETMQ